MRSEGRVYSIGYESFTQSSFLECMQRHGVEVVVDVRLNAVSRKKGFSRRGLSEALRAVGIEYLHEPELGNPQENRAAFRTGDGSAGRQRMREILAEVSASALHRVATLASGRRIAVLCVEQDHGRCHRGVITDALMELEPGLQVLHVN